MTTKKKGINKVDGYTPIHVKRNFFRINGKESIECQEEETKTQILVDGPKYKCLREAINRQFKRISR